MLASVCVYMCVYVLVCVGVSSAHFEHFHFQCSQPTSHREVPFQQMLEAIMEEILELMRKRLEGLEAKLEIVSEVLLSRTEEWEKEIDGLVDALLLQLNNKLAREALNKQRRIETVTSRSGMQGVEISNVELPKCAARKVGITLGRQGLSVEADIGESTSL